MSSFVQGLLKTTEDVEDEWLGSQILAFENRCKERSAQGARTVDMETKNLPVTFVPKDVADKLQQKLSGYGFTECRSEVTGTYGCHKAIKIYASWSGLTKEAKQPQGGGGYAKTCGLVATHHSRA